MAINKVGSKGIEDGSVATADFAPGTVSSDKLQDNAVTNAKLTNTSVTLTGSSVSLGGSVSFNNKFVDWQSVITADGSTFNTAVSGQGYFIDTTSAAHTITLPASASIGDFIAIKDYAGTFATNNLTIARNGHNIQGVANDSLISTNRASLVLVYVDSTKGWLYWEESNVSQLYSFISATGGTVTTSGDYKIHAFTGDGCFVVSSVGTGDELVDYLVVAGGGGGGGAQHGGNQRSGGGGAGGYRESHSTPVSGCYTASPLATPTGITVSATTYPVTVGAGGSGNYNGRSNGSDSVFSTITSTGGGYGGEVRIGAPADDPTTGGSGGGASASSGNCRAGAAGNTPPVSPPQGNAGGSSTGYNAEGGGGGGAIEAGNTDGQATGGDGASSEISGSAVTRAGGGAGNFVTIAAEGGGGVSPSGPQGTGGAGSANTGGGGGAGRGSPSNPTGGGSGGKGIVIIRYKYQ
jgi:hypothetical protein